MSLAPFAWWDAIACLELYGCGITSNLLLEKLLQHRWLPSCPVTVVRDAGSITGYSLCMSLHWMWEALSGQDILDVRKTFTTWTILQVRSTRASCIMVFEHVRPLCTLYTCICAEM